MGIELIERNGVRYAEIIRAGARAQTTSFISADDAAFQSGLLAGPADYIEPAHSHPRRDRGIRDLQELIVLQRGRITFQIYADEGGLLAEVTLAPGDAIVLVHGVHGYRASEPFQALILKQGPRRPGDPEKLLAPQ